MEPGHPEPLPDWVGGPAASPHEADPLQQSLGWKLSGHARKAALSRGYSLVDVLLAVVDPEVTHTSYNYSPVASCTSVPTSRVLDPHNRYVVTVLLRSHQPWTDDDAVHRTSV